MGQHRNSRRKTTGLRLRDLPVNRSDSPVRLRVPQSQASGDHLHGYNPQSFVKAGTEGYTGSLTGLLSWWNNFLACFSCHCVSNCLLWQIAWLKIPYFHPNFRSCETASDNFHFPSQLFVGACLFWQMGSFETYFSVRLQDFSPGLKGYFLTSF